MKITMLPPFQMNATHESIKNISSSSILPSNNEYSDSKKLYLILEVVLFACVVLISSFTSYKRYKMNQMEPQHLQCRSKNIYMSPLIKSNSLSCGRK